MSSNYYLQQMMSDPEIANNPRLLNLVSSAADQLDWSTPNSGTPDPMSMYKTYNDRRDALLNYYKEQSDAAQKAANAGSTNTEQDYNNTIESLNRGLQEDTSKLADTEGQSGTWGSSARADRANSLASKYNTQYNTAYNTAVNNLETGGINNQLKLGGNFYSPSINKYQAGTSGLSSQVGNTYRYNPFQQKSGSIAANQAYSLSGLSTGK